MNTSFDIIVTPVALANIKMVAGYPDHHRVITSRGTGKVLPFAWKEYKGGDIPAGSVVLPNTALLLETAEDVAAFKAMFA